MPPSSFSEREALARVAFGRTASSEDESRAAEAARRLHELDLLEAAGRQALQRAALDAADARERRAHRIRSRSFRVLVALAVMGVIALGAAMLLAPPLRSSTPLDAGAANGPAGSWFDEAQTDRDRVDSYLPSYVDGSTTRLVSMAMPGWKVYVAKGDNADLCLVVHESGTTKAVAECVTPEVFAESGVVISSVGSTSISAFWDGADVHVGQNGSSVGQGEP